MFNNNKTSCIFIPSSVAACAALHGSITHGRDSGGDRATGGGGGGDRATGDS